MSKETVVEYSDIYFYDQSPEFIRGCIGVMLQWYGPETEYSLEIETDDCVRVCISYPRVETDDEYEARLKEEQLTQNRKRALYEKLKKEFEGG